MLTQSQKSYITKLIEKGEELPEEFKYLLFPAAQKEYELNYDGKIRKEDLLANEDGVFPVPLQVDKTFNSDTYESHEDNWKNMIVFGDNLQFLKTINENKDPLVKNKVKGKIKLIYIDPPFATLDEFQSREGAKAYNDKKKGAEFIEFLRRRLILAREILAEDGCIFLHIDQKMGHYIKIIMDEVFEKNNFRNEIIWKYESGGIPETYFSQKHDVILFYSKSGKWTFNKNEASFPRNICQMCGTTLEKWNNLKKHVDNDGRVYRTIKSNGKIYKYYDDEPILLSDTWVDINHIQQKDPQRTGYPTQKPEALLERIIRSATNEGDIVLDFFGGSGTTISVAEKLNRKWIACDLGKLSYFTMQKRILQIQDSKDLIRKGNYKKYAKCFITAQLGVYDLKKAFELEWLEYQQFVSGLFEIEIDKHEIAGLEFDGKKGDYPVKMFDYRKFKDSAIDVTYLEEIHSIIGTKVAGRVYLIAPANYVEFLTDYHEIDDIRYYFLKVPYQIIKELHKAPFQRLKQPQSKKNVNNVDEVVGFHFIRTPKVKSEIVKDKDSITIYLKEFKSQYRKDEEGQILKNFESLSAIFIDKNYNGKSFEMDDAYFAEDLLTKKIKNDEIRDELVKTNDLQIILNSKETGKQIMIVYTDIYGNDFSEVFAI